MPSSGGSGPWPIPPGWSDCVNPWTPTDIGRLFVAFQQLDAGAAKQYPGTGLGLALTKRLVEAQGGRVGVRSAVAAGTVFSAVLPHGR